MEKFVNQFNQLIHEYTNEMLEIMKLQNVLPKRKFKKFINFHIKQHELKMKQFFNQYK